MAYLEHGSVKEAAFALKLAEQTVKVHLARIRQKTGAKTTAQAVYWLQLHLRPNPYRP